MNCAERPVKAGEACEKLGLNMRYLESFFQASVRNNILKSVRGPHGGYVTAREKRKITLTDIYDAYTEAEAKEELTFKIDSNLLEVYEGAKGYMRECFAKISLEELCEKSTLRKQQVTGGDGISNFNI